MSFNRKRRFDYREDQSVPGGGGFGGAPGGFGNGGGGRPFNKRPRRFNNNSFYSQLSAIEKTTINVCKDINKIGEDCDFGDLLKNLNHISIPIAVEFNKEDYFRNNCLLTIYTTLIEQPHKIILLSCLVQISNAKNQTIGKYVVEFFHQKCLDLISFAVADSENAKAEAFNEKNSNDTGPWNKLKLVLRFFATLTALISKESILKVFQQHLDVAIELQKQYGDKRCPLAEALYYNTLISIPYLIIFNDADETFKDQIREQLLQRASEFKVSAENDSVELIKPFYNSKSTEQQQQQQKQQDGSQFALPYEPKLLISTVLPAIKELAKDDFSKVLDNLFPDLHVISGGLIRESLAAEETILSNLPQLSFPPIDVLKKHAGLDKGIGKIDSLWRVPRLLFEVFPPNSAFETMPNVSSYEGLLFKDLTQDVLESLEYNKKLASNQLLSIDFFFKPGLFVPINKSLNELTAIHELNQSIDDVSQRSSTWAVEDIIVENALSLIFQLPNAQTLPIYYYNVLVDACERAPVGMAPRFGKAMRYFYNNMALLDFELRLRFMDWMSMQLSNFQFKWKWNEWSSDSSKLNGSRYHPKKVFVKNLIFKEIRLSTKERIYESFGDDVAEFGKYLNIAILNTIEKVNAYDEEIWGTNVVTENTAKVLAVDKTIDQPLLKFIEHPSIPFYNETIEFLQLVQEKAGGNENEFWKFFSKIDELLAKEEKITNKERFKINFLFQVICFAGSRSISHFETFICKVLFRIKKLLGFTLEESEIIKTEEMIELGFDYNDTYLTGYKPIEDKEELHKKELWIIEAVLRYWNDTPQNGFIILEILAKLKLLSAKAVFEFLFIENSDGEIQLLTNSLATEIFFKNLSKIAQDKSSNDERVVDNFTFVVEKTVCLLNSVTSKLQEIGKLEAQIDTPTADISSEVVAEPDYDLKWKYVTGLGLIKSVLRKYSDEVLFVKKPVLEKIANIEHEDTKQKISKWIDDLQFL